jgi:hypothetical protein
MVLPENGSWFTYKMFEILPQGKAGDGGRGKKPYRCAGCRRMLIVLFSRRFTGFSRVEE